MIVSMFYSLLLIIQYHYNIIEGPLCNRHQKYTYFCFNDYVYMDTLNWFNNVYNYETG